MKFATKMDGMFRYTGYNAMQVLDLGDSFDTSNITSMNKMFDHTGYTAMSTLKLGKKFNTAKVTDMSYMFNGTGSLQLTSLSLGEQFYTTAVKYMTSMFQECGSSNMTVLDLGPAFTKIADNYTWFATDCGKNGTIVINVGSSIYSSNRAFRLGVNSTTTILCSQVNKIVPKYKPEWSKVSSTLDESSEKITIDLQGNVNSTNYGEANKVVTNNTPIKPNSSLIIEKIKSVCGSGK